MVLNVLVSVLALSAIPSARDASSFANDAPAEISAAVNRRLDRADAALAATGQVPNRSLQSRALGERMLRLQNAPPPAEPVVREFDYELLAKIAAKNKLVREKRREQGIVEPYRKPEPNYLSGSGVVASASKKPSQREAIAKAHQKLRQVSLMRQMTLPRPST